MAMPNSGFMSLIFEANAYMAFELKYSTA